MMSSTGLQRRTLVAAVRHLWAIGGIHAYYRGLSVRLSYLRLKCKLIKNLVDWISRRFSVRRAICVKKTQIPQLTDIRSQIFSY